MEYRRPRMHMLYPHAPHPHKPRNANDLHKQEQDAGGFNAKLAVVITKAFGSIKAFYFLVAWMFIWMALASSGVWLFANDKYPFQFLLFLSNLVQLWALPVLAVGQSVLGRKQEIQAEEDFNINQKSFHDIEQIMQHLLAQDAELVKHTEALEKLMRMIAQATNREVA